MYRSLCNIVLSFVMLLLCSYASAQRVCIFTRDSETEAYRVALEKKCSDSLSADSYLKRYMSKMHRKLYIYAGYDSVKYDKDKIEAYATLGKPLQNVTLDVSEVPFPVSRRKKRNPLLYPVLCEQTVKYYTDRGYLFATVNIDSVIFDDNYFSAKVKVDKGQIIKVDSLIINGSAKISNTYIERTLELKHGKTLTTEKIDKIDSRIKNIPFVEQEQAYQLAFSDTKSDVLLFLKNEKASSFSGVLGIMPKSQTTGKLLITGDVNLSLVNAFHHGENFKFNWKKYETQNQTLNVGGVFPYIFKSPVGLGADFSLEKKDSSYLKTDFFGKVMVGNQTSRGFYIYYRNTASFPIGNNDSISGNFSSFKANLFGFGFYYCSVDNMRNPYKGLIFSTTADAGRKNETETKTTLFHANLFYDISGYVGVVRGFTIKLRNSSKFIYSKSVFNNELLWVGGMNSIRGFDELSLPATYYTLGTIELRYLFERNSAVYVLTDAMYFGKMFTEETSKNYAMGIGAGIDLNTPAGIFSLVYAIGKQNENPFSFNNSKIHFGYKSYF